MPENKSISFTEDEYPQLKGLPAGSKVKLEITATLEGDEGEGDRVLVFDAVDISTEGQADRELKTLTQQSTAAAGSRPQNTYEDL